MSLLKKIFPTKIKTLNDPFFKRLSSAVVGGNMLSQGNIYLMDLAVKHMPLNGCVLEIGCYGGNSSLALIYLLKKYRSSADLYACDCWIYEGFNDHTGKVEDHFDGYPSLKRKAFMEHLKKNYVDVVKLFHPDKLPYTVALDSDSFFEAVFNKKEVIDLFDRKINLPTIGFAYIDGGHSYEQCKKDFINVDKCLLSNGYILFDDSADDQDFGSVLFMKEMMKDPKYKFIDKNPNYLFKKV